MSAARLARALLLALLASLAGGCATTTFTKLAYANTALAYNNLAPMLTWTVDAYIDLGDAQEDFVRSRVKQQVAWHRSHELPRYAKFFDTALEKSAQPFTAEDLAPLHREIRASYHAVLAHAAPDIAELLGGLDEAQAAHLARKFAEENHKYERDSIRGTPEERRRKRMHRFIDHLESWIGSLEGEQRAMVAKVYEDLPDLSDDVLGERRYWQGEVLALVRAKAPRAEMEAKLRRLLVEADTWRRPEYLEKIRARDRKGMELLAAISATMSERQRAALQERIRGFLRDIARLTSSG